MAEVTWRNYLEHKHSRPSPLKGIKVLEVCTLILGPAGPSFLAKLGAEVVKCEIPPLGGTSRNLIPFGDYFREQGAGFVHANENKYWMGLDLHKPEGQEIFRQLAAQADIVEENMRPGVLEKWNVGYGQLKEINPDIIYISKNGYGQWGRYAEENMPSNDGASQAWSGYAWLSSHPGRRPLKSRLNICDNYGAATGEVAVLAALHYRQRTGKGQFIELSQTESIVRMMSWVWPYQQITGKAAQPAGNRDLCVSPADTFRCSGDQFVAIAAGMPKDFSGLCQAMGRPELAGDPRFRDHLTRLRDENTLELLKIISEWVKDKTPDEVEQMAETFGFAATRIRSVKDIVDDEHCRERGFMAYVDDPLLGPFYEYDFPVMMSKTPPKVKWSVRAIGFDNEFIMTYKLGRNKDEIQKCYECGALGKWADLISRRPPSDRDGQPGIIPARPETKTAERGE